MEDKGLHVGSCSQWIGVAVTNISMLSADLRVECWDIVKMNCEGAEYEILSAWPGPISRQIVVSYHEHYRPRGDAYIGGVRAHLSKWYAVVRHEKDARYYAGPNYWDDVYVLKGLVA